MVSHFLFFFFFWLVSISPHSHKIELFDSSGDHNNPSSSSSFFQHLPLRSSSSSILMSPEFCSIKIEDEIADLTKFGTASKTIGRDTYVVKLCEKIQDIMVFKKQVFFSSLFFPKILFSFLSFSRDVKVLMCVKNPWEKESHLDRAKLLPPLMVQFS